MNFIIIKLEDSFLVHLFFFFFFGFMLLLSLEDDMNHFGTAGVFSQRIDSATFL